MPRFLHLADLHLGRIFHGESLIEDQVHLLDQVMTRAGEDPPDAVLLAGDIYDRAFPPVDAVKLFDSFLTSLADAGITVVAIPGNHDSAGRMAYASGAWEKIGVHIRADYLRLEDPVTVMARDGVEFDIFALPFVETAVLRQFLTGIGSGVDEGDDIPGGDKTSLVRAAVNRIRTVRTTNRSAVLMAHEFVTGSIESGSERLYVGGSQSIPSELFEGFDYVALGHIHGTQRAGDEIIRYAGSPMAYAFDEAARPKGYLEVILDSSQLYPEVNFHPLTPLRPLEVLEDSLENLLRNPEYDRCRQSYVSARVTDSLSHMNLIGRLRDRFPYLRELRQTALEAVVSDDSQSPSAIETPESVLSDFLDRAGWEEGDDRTMAESLLTESLPVEADT